MDQETTQLSPQSTGPNFKGLFMLIGILALVGLGYMFWQNRRLEGQVELSKAKLLMLQTPSLSASGSAHPQDVAQVLGSQTETKPTLTPTAAPQAVTAAAPVVIKTVAVSPLTRVYFDAQFPYEIRFNDSWIFRRTHGTDTGGQSDQILSRADLSRDSLERPRAYVAFEILSSNGLTSLEEWLNNYDSGYKYGNSEKIEFQGQTAARFTTDGGHSQRIYFLKGAFAYRLSAWENDTLSAETLAILNSFKLK